MHPESVLEAPRPNKSEAVPVAPQTAQHDRLLKLVEELTLFHNEDEPFTLASGRKSHFIFNLKNLYGNPEAATLITERLFDLLKRLKFDYITGLELGAVFPVTAVILRSHGTERPIEGFIIRKKAKGHGTKNRIEGLRNLPNAGTVVVLDDVTTTGGSLYEAVEAVQEAGLEVKQAVTLVDREEGAAEFLASKGIELIPLFRKTDFLAADVA